VLISINKNSESGARIRYATFFNVIQCQTDESLAGPEGVVIVSGSDSRRKSIVVHDIKMHKLAVFQT